MIQRTPTKPHNTIAFPFFHVGPLKESFTNISDAYRVAVEFVREHDRPVTITIKRAKTHSRKVFMQVTEDDLETTGGQV